jgi:hypothetical protein
MKKKDRGANSQAELAFLKDRVYNNESIYRLRGRWKSLTEIDESIHKRTKVSEVEADIKQYGKDLVVAAVLKAKLRRDGQVTAEDFLASILLDSWRILDGEEFPQEWMRHLTLYMLRPDKTLLLIELLRRNSPPHLCRAITSGEYYSEVGKDDAERLDQAFPAARDLFKQEGPEKAGPAIMAAYALDVLSNYPSLPTVAKYLEIFASTSIKYYYDLRYDKVADILKACGSPFNPESYSALIPAFAFLTEGRRDDVLMQLGDPEGRTVAVWEFVIPKFVDELRNTTIAFNAKPKFRALPGYNLPFMSINLDLGFGALLIKGQDTLPESHEYDFILRA